MRHLPIAQEVLGPLLPSAAAVWEGRLPNTLSLLARMSWLEGPSQS
ncbi:hypothetical protein [Brachybacterium massiliense]|nr:hypothetical protein [Brachybacterium massiliense]